MDCYECAIKGNAVASTGVCLKCGAALCLEHLGEAARYTVGGLRYGCHHHLDRAVVTRHLANGHVVVGPRPEPVRAAR